MGSKEARYPDLPCSRIPWIHELGEGHRVRVPLLISRSNIADIGMGRFGSAWYIHLPSLHRNSLGAS